MRDSNKLLTSCNESDDESNKSLDSNNSSSSNDFSRNDRIDG